MKAFKKNIAVGLSVVAMAALFAGCAKPPTTELEAAKASVSDAVGVMADKYAKEELKSLNDKMVEIDSELKKQEGKLFKNYDVAKQLIAQATTTAGTVKETAMQRKEEARTAAAADSAAATAAVAAAGELLGMAPTGKGTKADIEAMKADVAVVEGELAEVESLIAGEEYYAASDKAKAISAKAADISAQVQAAIDKSGKGRKK